MYPGQYLCLLYNEQRLAECLPVRGDPQPGPGRQPQPPSPPLHSTHLPRMHRVVTVEVGHGEAELGRGGVGQMEDGRRVDVPAPGILPDK